MFRLAVVALLVVVSSAQILLPPTISSVNGIGSLPQEIETAIKDLEDMLAVYKGNDDNAKTILANLIRESPVAAIAPVLNETMTSEYISEGSVPFVLGKINFNIKNIILITLILIIILFSFMYKYLL